MKKSLIPTFTMKIKFRSIILALDPCDVTTIWQYGAHTNIYLFIYLCYQVSEYLLIFEVYN